MSVEPYAIGVCSWSLQVTSIPELRQLLDRLGVNVIQIACGDPHHASWAEGDAMPEAARAAGFQISAAMLGFPGEDYTTPATIKLTGGFGDPATRAERMERFKWAAQRTRELGANLLMFHGGFLPEPDDPDRKAFLDTLGQAAAIGKEHGIRLGLETGQETAELLRRTLDDLKCDNVGVNFDPANMLLYDMGDPIQAIEILGPDITSVHCKDANRPTTAGAWGSEVPLGEGQVNMRAFVEALKRVGYAGPLVIEREVGNQEARLRDCAHGIRVLQEILAG
jgi:sugar phosphate isomerase/epimerase